MKRPGRDQEYFFSPWMGCWSIAGLPSSIKIAGTHWYTWVERGTVRVKCLTQEHNTMSPARVRTRTARSGVESTNHEAFGVTILRSVNPCYLPEISFLTPVQFAKSKYVDNLWKRVRNLTQTNLTLLSFHLETPQGWHIPFISISSITLI